ncbi:phosphate ABC transporter ATP-binding protein, PhoT family [Desulfocicer vacuolatum DSM 3385]|uniref:Phosphate ABC transporter ATP-binding protein, PhoT family n=1 Tax=Desulfocicer vacuolatum DSM 3385 TaxID=1121400 RepID=A0A1W2E6L2_9BACT|nr:ATP-binding cassette domain-containing protein [Desulfocicer vacuolatum]SMD05285.1 phosphate ABC transporter ATP-binding protein, PhoT family [Desulfocicer vacuolatum DSM 3385]
MKKTKIKVQDLNFFYGPHHILNKINLDIPAGTITAVSGPSGQGKSSLLTALNRLWENIDGARATGRIWIDFGKGLEEISKKEYNVHHLRQKVGMVFQMPNPLPMSILKNMQFPLKLAGISKNMVPEKIETALQQAHLWEEVKDRLSSDAQMLSGGQLQRLCIARSLVIQPEVLLLDEPTASLDPASVEKIEQLLLELKSRCTIVMVSHYMDQIRRIADRNLLLSNGNLSLVTTKEQ